MQKVTDFLEKNVQWVAIALGGIYLIWMVYCYVLNTSTMDVQVGGQQMAPGKVDSYVLNNVAQPLAEKIKSARPVPIPVPDFGDAVNLKVAEPPALAVNWTNSQTRAPLIPDLTQNPNNPANPAQPGPGGTAVAGVKKVEQLPQPPKPTELATSMGRSSVYIPPQMVNATFLQAQQAATAAPAANGQPPQQPPPAPQPPPQPQIQTGPNGQPQLVGQNGQVIPGTDIDWVTVSYKIQMQDLANEFNRCNIPQGQQGQGNTCFLDVELLRQEQLPNGQWGNDTVVPKLTTTDQPSMPDEKNLPPRAVLQAYVNWATSNLAELLHPAFYTFLQGDQWMLPSDLTGMTVVADNGQVETLGPTSVRQGFDPNAILSMTPAQRNAISPPLTAKERSLVAKAADDKRRADAQSRAKANLPSRSPRGGQGPGGAPAVGDTARPPIPRPFNGGGDQAAGGGAPEEGVGGANPTQPQQPPTEAELLQKYQQMFPLPSQGDFDPRTMSNSQTGQQGQPVTLVGWAHDATAQPGKTYRYAVIYKIKSPVWGTFNTTNPQNLVNTFALSSTQSDWTQPVTVPPIVRFYFVSNSAGPSMPVEVYRWQNGIYNKARIEVSPGDEIGKTIKNVDYATNFTVVDFRPEPGRDDTTVWLLNPDGQLVRRDSKADTNSTDLNQMRKLYDQQQQQLQQQQQQNNGQPGAPGAPTAGQANAVGGARAGNDPAH